MSASAAARVPARIVMLVTATSVPLYRWWAHDVVLGMTMPSESVHYAASDVGDSGGGPVGTAAHGTLTGVPAVAHPATDDLDNIPIGWIRWRPLGQLSLDQGGDLVFPSVTAEPGIYRFMIHDGTEVIAGYIGQAAKSLATRFGLYRTRGRKPSYPLEKKTTSRNALLLTGKLQAGNTVSVSVVDHRVACADGRELLLDLADKAFRSSLERRLILQLCETGIEVWNRNGNPSWERRL